MAQQGVEITIRFNTKPAADAMQQLLQIVDQVGGKVEEMPTPIPPTAPSDIDKLGKSSTNARLALQQLTFVISDAPTFMTNFRFGMMAVGNNLDMVARTMLQLREETKQTGQTMSGALVQSLKGPAGVILALSTLIALLQVLPELFNKSRRAAEDAAEKGLDEFARRVRESSTEVVKASLAEIRQRLGENQKRLDELKKSREEAVLTAGFAPGSDTLDKLDAEIARLTTIIADEKKMKDILTGEGIKREEELQKGLRGQLDARKKNLEAQLDEAKTEGEIVRLNREIHQVEQEIQRLRELGVVTEEQLLQKLNDTIDEEVEQRALMREINDNVVLADIDIVETSRQRFEIGELTIGQYKKILESELAIATEEEKRVRIKSALLQFEAQELLSTKNLIIDMGQTAQQVLGNEASRGFMRAWENTFGEINSVWENLVSSMVNMLIQRLMQAAVADTLFSLFKIGQGPTGFFSFIGSIFGAAEGAVVTRPTMLVAGEAGTEAILPISKLPTFLPQVTQSTDNSVVIATLNRRLESVIDVLQSWPTVLRLDQRGISRFVESEQRIRSNRLE
ncbi:MAG TPA: hypothetical protein VNN76_11525 [Bacteroidota bacterium]|nr:hypothetical protein [Bacteroidota bacterium]